MLKKTQSLMLESLTLDHAPFIYEHNHGNVKTYFNDFSSLEEVRCWIRQRLMHPHVEEWMARYNKKLIGGIALYPLRTSDTDLKKHIGLWISPSEQGKNMGSLMLNALIKKTRQDELATILYYNCAKNNIASKRLAEKTGFRLRGSTEDELQFVLKV